MVPSYFSLQHFGQHLQVRERNITQKFQGQVDVTGRHPADGHAIQLAHEARHHIPQALADLSG